MEQTLDGFLHHVSVLTFFSDEPERRISRLESDTAKLEARVRRAETNRGPTFEKGTEPPKGQSRRNQER